MSSWSVTIPFNPRATPRPNYRVGPRKKGKKEYGVITYYDTWYFNYLAAIDTYLKKYNLKNQDFYKVVNAQYGVIANIVFYIHPGNTITKISKIPCTNVPDIDNLLKAILDGIFTKEDRISDSRVVGVNALKLNELENPRTEITLSSLGDFDDTTMSPSETVIANVAERNKEQQLNWSVILPFSPKSAPRPSVNFSVSTDSKGKKVYKKHDYNDRSYTNYLLEINNYLTESNLYNDKFYKIGQSKNGIMSTFHFYCAVPKNQKKIRNIMKKTTPDIDNLLKAAMDGIFNGVNIDDRRIVGVQALKFNVLENAHTEVNLSPLGT